MPKLDIVFKTQFCYSLQKLIFFSSLTTVGAKQLKELSEEQEDQGEKIVGVEVSETPLENERLGPKRSYKLTGCKLQCCVLAFSDPQKVKRLSTIR